MNYSNCTLHVIGSKEAIDKHHKSLIASLAERLNDIPGYGIRCADCFHAVRHAADHLSIGFRTPEGDVAQIWPPASNLLLNESALSFGPQTLASDEDGPIPNEEDGIWRPILVPQKHAPEDRLVMLLTFSNESQHYCEEYAMIRVQIGPEIGELYHPGISRFQFVAALKAFVNVLAADWTKRDAIEPQDATVSIGRVDCAEILAQVESEQVSKS